MSLAIDLSEVRRVLLVDGWHEIVPGSLSLDSYEMHDLGESAWDYPGTWSLRAGTAAGVAAVGFGFTRVETFERVRGPLPSLLAVETVARESTGTAP